MSAALTCQPCDVTWSADEATTCWVCDRQGLDASRLEPVSALSVGQAIVQQRLAEQRRAAAERVRRTYAAMQALRAG